MYKKYSGFTLIELIIVIIILGVLSVIALPQFIDLTADSRNAAVQGVAGALASANAINYATRKEGQTAATYVISNCTNVATALLGGAVPTSYAINSLAVASGVTSNCSVTLSTAGSTYTATFQATGIT